MDSETKVCQNCKQGFVIEPDDFAIYERMKIPAPTFCPECRMIRRMAWRNERSLYKRKCALCQNEKIGMYAPEKPYNVVCRDCWYSDKWDGLSFGADYNWSKPLLEQWNNLLHQVPIFSLQTIRQNTGSDFANFVSDNKNCYLSFSIVGSENIFYSYATDKSKDCMDLFSTKNSELCYENIDSSNNYKSIYAINCTSCLNSSFIFDCINCQNCFMGSNLRNKNYVLRGKQLTKEEYEKEIKAIDFGSYSAIQKLEAEYSSLMREHSLHKFAHILNSSNCSGNHIDNSKNAHFVFSGYELENVSYAVRSFSTKDSRDGYGFVHGSLLVETFGQGHEGYDAAFSYFTDSPRSLRYCSHCYFCSDCFACLGLKNQQYCILNKQYTKEEYEAFVPKIIDHMNEMPYLDKKGITYKYGEFFPAEISPFAYNETIAQDFFPLTKERATEKGYCWRDLEEREYKITKKSEDLPDNIKDVADFILEDVIQCAHNQQCNEQCTKAFKIIKEELQFYKKMNLPIPRLCPNCRHYQRLQQRNPLKLWHRQCMCEKSHSHHTGKCTNEFETSYAPDRPEIVYCEQCYQEEVA